MEKFTKNGAVTEGRKINVCFWQFFQVYHTVPAVKMIIFLIHIVLLPLLKIWTCKMVSHLSCSIFIMRRGLKSDGHGNGGTLINGNGGTHYPLSTFRQPLLSSGVELRQKIYLSDGQVDLQNHLSVMKSTCPTQEINKIKRLFNVAP